MKSKHDYTNEQGNDFRPISGRDRACPPRQGIVRRGLFCSVLAGFFLVTSCRDILTTTVVHRDGSLDRRITVTGDSSEVFDSTLAIPRDSSWEVIRRGRSEKGSTRYVYSIKKTFQSADELNRDFGAVPSDSTRPARKVEFTGRFRWFYTFLTYREVYPQWNQYAFIPMHEYFTDQELRDVDRALRDEEPDRILSGQDSLLLEKKFNTWIGKNVFEAVYLTLAEVATESSGTGVNPDTLLALKDSVWAVVSDSLDSGTSPYPEAAMIARITGRLLGRPAAPLQLYQTNESKFETVQEAMDMFSGIRKVPDELKRIGIQSRPEYASNDSNVVVMPGLILGTNAETVQDNTVGWNTEPAYYFVHDYVMWVESRVVNLWAFILTGAFLVVFITGIVIIFVRKKEQ